MTKQNPSIELLAFLREEVGVVPQKGDVKFPTRKQALAKGFFNTMDVKFFEDGSYEYDF